MMLTLLLTLGLSAHSALAYLTPEQVLLQQQEYFGTTQDNYFTPNSRRATQQMQAQEAARMSQHPDTTYDPNLESNAGTTVGRGDTPASASSSSLLPAAPAAAGTSSSVSIDPVMLRLLQRLQRQDAQANTNAVIAQQRQPLTPSGPAETLVILAVVVAVSWTVLRAWRTGEWRLFAQK